MTDSIELTEEQLNTMSEELFERMAVTLEEQKAELGPKPEPVLSATVPEAGPVTQLTPEAQAEVAGDLARAQQDPIVPKQMTRQVWKQMMRMHFTVRRGRAQPCGHKINIEADPRNNCENCWFTYFNNNKTYF